MKAFTRTILVTIISLFILSWTISGISATSTMTVVLAGLAIALLNLTLKPILKVMLLPINLLTLGALNWLINLLVLYIALWLVPGFRIWPIELFGMEFGQFWSLVIFSFALSFTNGILAKFI